jgi:DNA polymerase delta subunit 2
MEGGKKRDILFSYEFTGKRFIQELQFSSQYFNLYRHRLEELRGCINSSDASCMYMDRITDVKQDQHVFVVGIIVRSHVSRISNIEKYIVKVGVMDPRPSLGNFSGSEDVVFLEDENGRIKIDTTRLETEWMTLVTGVVVGVRGIVKEDAILHALDLYFPEASFPKEINIYKDEYICFVSGLEIGYPYLSHTLFHVFIDFFLGAMDESDNGISTKIVRMVILGDSIYKPLDARTIDRKAVGENDLKGFQEMSSSLKQLDAIISELSGIFPVDLVPGEMDPTNASMPQQPLSPYLFPYGSLYSALQSFPNPYEFKLDEVSILCTSGQNIVALSSYIPENISTTELMALTLKFKHLAPNAPDALQCIPMQQNDPFIIRHLPNLYVVGNMKEYKTAVSCEGVRLLAVPKFSITKSFVIVNRFSLESKAITLQELVA